MFVANRNLRATSAFHSLAILVLGENVGDTRNLRLAGPFAVRPVKQGVEFYSLSCGRPPCSNTFATVSFLLCYWLARRFLSGWRSRVNFVSDFATPSSTTSDHTIAELLSSSLANDHLQVVVDVVPSFLNIFTSHEPPAPFAAFFPFFMPSIENV